MNKKWKGILLLLTLMSTSVLAGPTVVGNGDDGTDLEGFEKLESGNIVDARAKAIEKLKEMNVKAVPGLGNLLSEVEKADLYITRKDLPTKKLMELGAFTNDAQGLVYARTFPRPHAPTRFFPAAKNLDERQLVSLHIHEALHRALPESIREDETAAAEITLAITSPNSSYDRINETVQKFLKKAESTKFASATPMTSVAPKPVIKPTKHSRLNYPSKVGIRYKRFNSPKFDSTEMTSIPVTSMTSISSHLYPFGGSLSALGVGIDASIINKGESTKIGEEDDGTFMGPLGLSARMLLWTAKGFDIEAYGRIDLNTMSNEELQESLLGRDITKVGMTFAKRTNWFYVENDLEYTLPSETNQKIGNIHYKYEFGSITTARVKMGGYYKAFNLGGYLEMHLADNFKATGGAFKYETGRNRVVSAGPEIEWRFQQFGLRLFGKYLLDSTKNTDFDFLGDLMGHGVGQGNVGLELNFFL